MTHSTLWLSQIQFFSSLGFMLLFLVIELGLAWILLYFKLRSLGPDHAAWIAAYRFWVRVFALAFILSFAASLPVLIQFGSLWPSLMDKIGNVAGPLLAAGILSAFVFKSCFLGAMLFGQRYLSDKIHALVVLMVAVGVTVSSFWLLVLLSWMHAPTGAQFVDGQYQVVDWLAVLFNPALPWYAGLFILAAALTTAFLMMGMIAAQSLRRPADDSGRLVFKSALWVAAVSIVLQGLMVAGMGNMTAQYQPAKAAATAAYWHSGEPADLVLFAWPDAQAEANRSAWLLPRAGAAWLGRDAAGDLRGLDQFSGMAPPVPMIFWSFRLAVLAGLAMLVIAWLTAWRARRVQYDPGALSRGWRHVLAGMTFSGWVLLLAGLAYILLGAFPYAVTGTVTLSEVTGSTSFETLLGGYLAYLAFYLLFLLGFFQMLRHIARFGVVPIARRRGRA
ncbi:cytochrome ubiquinol oxidase subunit I [Pusillimonas sp. SM2304]|uniref:cytochrome ubiquinol oxidase subunit I n=1 Tax=Pusillimonas sp. SM2304 TaxID=3073241 RepID=UPI002874DBE6|nr:cytochrome ubiquinol oxidase subunit I [Pusillimonas sp. SM2304]MDS1140708.1 cytochrome ubiquinol oxidase subunit I [Pusillimonas sp. SM2304]